MWAGRGRRRRLPEPDIFAQPPTVASVFWPQATIRVIHRGIEWASRSSTRQRTTPVTKPHLSTGDDAVVHGVNPPGDRELSVAVLVTPTAPDGAEVAHLLSDYEVVLIVHDARTAARMPGLEPAPVVPHADRPTALGLLPPRPQADPPRSPRCSRTRPSCSTRVTTSRPGAATPRRSPPGVRDPRLAARLARPRPTASSSGCALGTHYLGDPRSCTCPQAAAAQAARRRRRDDRRRPRHRLPHLLTRVRWRPPPRRGCAPERRLLATVARERPWSPRGGRPDRRVVAGAGSADPRAGVAGGSTSRAARRSSSSSPSSGRSSGSSRGSTAGRRTASPTSRTSASSPSSSPPSRCRRLPRRCTCWLDHLGHRTGQVAAWAVMAVCLGFVGVTAELENSARHWWTDISNGVVVIVVGLAFIWAAAAPSRGEVLSHRAGRS